MAIYHRDKLPENIFPTILSNKPYINDAYVEQALPYARIGDYRSFLHVTYARSLIEKAKTHTIDIEKSVAYLGMFGGNYTKGASITDEKLILNNNANNFSK